VVVNDLGVSLSGEKADESAAEKVAREIRTAGGEAAVSADLGLDLVGRGEDLSMRARTTFGRIDAVVNNAGNLRDRIFIQNERRGMAGGGECAPRR
jgi:NAD(P)-dependent dehydrogenase (short-subunit alcohol dehydrogenase family)